MTKGNKRFTIGCLSAVAACGGVLCILAFLASAFFGDYVGVLSEPRFYEPMGRTLALYCQSDRSLFPEFLDREWFPPETDDLTHFWGALYPDAASVAFGGGLNQSAYALRRKSPNVPPEPNVWQLFCRGDDPSLSEILLTEIVLPSDARLSPDDLIRSVGAGFGRQLKKHPTSDAIYRRKIQFFLRLDRIPSARGVCREMLTAFPEDGWTVLVNALVRCEEQSLARGTEMMIQWVEKAADSHRYLNLAYFYALTSRPRDAAETIIQSTAFQGANWSYQGYSAAMSAFRAGDYEASLRLCTHLLPPTTSEHATEAAIRKLKAAAERALEGFVEQIPWEKPLVPVDPFEKLDIEKLLGRKVARPMEPK